MARLSIRQCLFARRVIHRALTRLCDKGESTAVEAGNGAPSDTSDTVLPCTSFNYLSLSLLGVSMCPRSCIYIFNGLYFLCTLCFQRELCTDTCYFLLYSIVEVM